MTEQINLEELIDLDITIEATTKKKREKWE